MGQMQIFVKVWDAQNWPADDTVVLHTITKKLIPLEGLMIASVLHVERSDRSEGEGAFMIRLLAPAA